MNLPTISQSLMTRRVFTRDAKVSRVTIHPLAQAPVFESSPHPRWREGVAFKQLRM
jgi:hypothetical protein